MLPNTGVAVALPQMRNY